MGESETGFLLTPKKQIGDQIMIHLDDEHTQNLRIQTGKQYTKGMQQGEIVGIDRASGRYLIQPTEGPKIELPFNIVDNPIKQTKDSSINPKS